MRVSDEVMGRIRTAQVARARTGLPLVEIDGRGRPVIRVAGERNETVTVPLCLLKRRRRFHQHPAIAD